MRFDILYRLVDVTIFGYFCTILLSILIGYFLSSVRSWLKKRSLGGYDVWVISLKSEPDQQAARSERYGSRWALGFPNRQHSCEEWVPWITSSTEEVQKVFKGIKGRTTQNRPSIFDIANKDLEIKKAFLHVSGMKARISKLR